MQQCKLCRIVSQLQQSHRHAVARTTTPSSLTCQKAERPSCISSCHSVAGACSTRTHIPLRQLKRLLPPRCSCQRFTILIGLLVVPPHHDLLQSPKETTS